MNSAPEIHIDHLSKSFGSNHVLDSISITFKKNKTTAVLGPSGTGKSVLLKLITGLLEPDSGSVLIGDKNFTNSSTSERSFLCRQMGILFQSAALFDSLTLLENVEFPLKYSPNKITNINERSKKHLKNVGLNGYENHMPGEVSIGMRKRAGIARAMVTEPSILLFDEPNTGLDPLVGQEIYDLINELRDTSDFTGVIVSHEIPEVFQSCDDVVMLYGGKVQFTGSVEEFNLSRNEIVHQFSTGEVDGPISVG